MSKAKFWSTITLSVLLGVLGFILGGIFPLPSPYGIAQSRILYALFGVLTGLLTFAQIASWVVKTTTTLIGHLVMVIASEVAQQLGKVAFHKTEEVTTEESEGAIILDTSSIIDGRVFDVARTGFLYGKIIVPEFVLEELQQVADSADSMKRARGRRGFEIIKHLKKVKGINLQIWEQSVSGKKVDEKLLNLGKNLKGRVLTTDYNLGSVAKLRGVEILNLNNLANSLRTLPVPGEKINVKLVHLGKDKDQGVGYFSDGTMVVVKDGAGLVGKEVSVEVAKVLQGSSGRMIFGRLD